VSAMPVVECLLHLSEEPRDLDDYRSGLVPRWCVGCGDNAILTAVQRLCRDEQLDPARTVFVSGIGCSSRLPHYMGTYGFHGTHGRALPIAEGVKMSRPDLPVFVSTGDGDMLSIGAAHWIHAIRYNMDLTVLLHDNRIYGLTKKQASPTSPLGTKSNTTPHGTVLSPLDPLSVSLGVANVSFVAQAVDWIPEALYAIVAAAYHHKGFSLVRIIQRCPEYMPGALDAYVQDPQKTLILTHPDGISLSPALATVYRNTRKHDPSDLAAARALTGDPDVIPVGILYRNDAVPRYEELRGAGTPRTIDALRRGLNVELDRFTIWTDTGPEQ
jgi:2-oxoglutarate/2-oxoacid ferredoxin oxidoreductase subunit beta